MTAPTPGPMDRFNASLPHTPEPWLGDWAPYGVLGKNEPLYFPISTSHVNGYPEIGNGLVALAFTASDQRLIAQAPMLYAYARRFFAAHDGTAGLTPEEVAAWREVVRQVEGL